MPLVGLTGVARSGKDTVGGFLVHDWGYERRAFADKLKEAALALDPIVAVKSRSLWQALRGQPAQGARLSELLDTLGPEGAKAHPEVRRLYQRLGTEVGRNCFGQDFWVEELLRHWEPFDRWVVTDVRFPNEAKAIIDHGGTLIRVIRPGFDGVNGHVSETAMRDFPVTDTIVNDGSLMQLADRVNDLVLEHALDPFEPA